MIQEPTATAKVLAAAGLSLPADAQRALDTITALRTAANANVTADAQAAVLSGQIGPDNAAQALHDHATALLRQEKAQHAARELEQPCAALFNQAIRTHAHKLLLALRKPFNEAAAVVTEAGKHFHPDADAETVLNAGVEAVKIHQQLGAALHTLGLVRNARMALAYIAGHDEQCVEWYITSATDAATLERARLAYNAPGNVWHNLTHAGFTLRLNAPDEAAKVTAGAIAATDAQEAAEREARLREHRESWAPTLEAMSARAALADAS